MNELTDGHTVHSFDEQLQQLHQRVIAAGDLAASQIVAAVQSLRDRDPNSAGRVVERDREIDALEKEVDDAIVHIVARRQPVARDLRAVLVVGKIMTDVERIGDQARRLARLTLAFYQGDDNAPAGGLLNDIPKLAVLVEGMVRQAMAAFAELNEQAAIAIIEQDDRLDEEVKDAMRRLSTYLLEDARSVGQVIDVTLGLRAIERIGSHAAYIARHTLFLSKGKDVRHESVEQVVQDVGDA